MAPNTAFFSVLVILFIVFAAIHVTGLELNNCKEKEEKQCLSASNTREEKTNVNSIDEREWNWNINGPHRCNIQRYTERDIRYRFGSRGLPPLFKKPIVIIPTGTKNDQKNDQRRNSLFANMTSLTNITNNLPTNMNVTLSSSNSFSARRRIISLTQYLHETIHREIYPTDLSNETWYLFGETYTSEWKKLLRHYQLPPCHTCVYPHVALSFGIGGKGSGVQWHVHGPGFSESVHGRKHWILYPPQNKPIYDPDFGSRHWMEHIYSNTIGMSMNTTQQQQEKQLQQQQQPKDASRGIWDRINSYFEEEQQLPYECTVDEGEMIYFPDGWHHATINLDPYTAFVSTFTTEHDVDQLMILP